MVALSGPVMKYSRVYVDAIGYELAPVVVTSAEIEQRLEPLYQKLKIPAGQLEAWTGINERRWWPAGHKLSDGATEAAWRARFWNIPTSPHATLAY